MGNTTLGIEYPDSTDHTRLWEHFQTMAEDVDALIAALQIRPSVRAYNTGGLTMANNTLTLIPLQAESTGMKTVTSMHSNVTNNSRLIASVNGIYQVSACLTYAAGATGRRVLQLRKNAAGVGGGGTQLHSANIGPGPSSGTTVTLTDDVSLNANDYLEMFGIHLQGGALGIDGAEFSTYVNMRLVRYL